ncbi:tRNA (adenosine(37)-N6)-threonylcarbamoyltransferase complex dimerization subunit type 1 TsaB [Aestuariivirga sp.]|uniref:tRNA (adenosine(37)-N6)-threonylcarbamoyltransferase complex dimerization subunit type 1 TsaB n=1 Tax=Aestuariivirga sp. TaxID=2650926 RepID=UPI00391B58DC
MKILALDTAMAACSAAVVDTERRQPLAAAFAAMARGHAEALAPMVAEVLARSGFDLRHIDRIAVTTGPGTFTGVRIGLSFARGLGLARHLPVIGIDSLSAVAANESTEAPLLVVADARNGEVYAARFDVARRRLSGPAIRSIDHAADDAEPGTLLIGTAARTVLEASGRSDLKHSAAGDLPVAARFAALAAEMIPGAMPSPLYLRAPDAKPQSGGLGRAGALTFQSVSLPGAFLLASLHAEAFEEGWSAGSFEDMLGMPGAAAEIALEHGEPVAFLLTRRAADEAEIITIGTRPAVQRRGVAQQLLAHRLKALAGEGVRRIFLEVAAGNARAQALYRAAGFEEAGRRKNYYLRKDGREDAIIMRRELSP